MIDHQRPQWLKSKIAKAQRRMRRVEKVLPLVVKCRVAGRMVAMVADHCRGMKKCKRNSLIARTMENDRAALMEMKWLCRDYGETK